MIMNKFFLTSTLERLGDLVVFLKQMVLSLLLRKRVLVSIQSVVSGKDIDGRIKGAEGRLSSHLWETSIV
jgi:hypothetical protein